MKKGSYSHRLNTPGTKRDHTLRARINLIKKNNNKKQTPQINKRYKSHLTSIYIIILRLIKLYNCLDDKKFNISLIFSSFQSSFNNSFDQGRIQKIQKRAAGTLASYIHAYYLFTEHSLKLIQNFKEKRGGHGQLSQTLNPSTLMFSKALQCQPEK